MKLYGYWSSSASWRVRIALHLKDLTYDYEPIHLIQNGGVQYSEGYRATNPMQQVPLLELEHRGRLVRVGQSLAIIELLDELYPHPALLPADPYLKARARQMAEIVNSGIQPLQNLGVRKRIKELTGGEELTWLQYWLGKGLTALEATMAETAGKFAVGDEVGIADLCLVPQLFNARRFKLDVEAWPTLLRVEAACAEMPAFQAARPEVQPDAVPEG